MGVKLKNIKIDYGTYLAVKDLSINIPTGKLVSFLGPSGCGKTTTLNALAGLINVSEGQILFDGIDVTSYSPQKRNIGLVFQDYALYPHLNVAKNIAFPLSQSKEFKRNVKKDNMYFKMKINNFADAKNLASNVKLQDELEQKIWKHFDVTYEELEKIQSEFIAENVAGVREYLAKLLGKNPDPDLKDKMTTYLLDKIRVVTVQIKMDVFNNISVQMQELIKNKKYNPIFEGLLNYFNNLFIRYTLKDIQREMNNVKATSKVSKKNIIKSQKKFNKANNKDLDIFNAEANKTIYSEYLKKRNALIDKTLYAKRDELKISSDKFFKSLENNVAVKADVNEKPKDFSAQIKDYKSKIFTVKRKINLMVQETAEKVGIETQLAKKPGELSGGQQQRVAIARAVIKQPRILLMDEPLSNLDAKLRASTRAWIRQLQQKLGITTVFVTHDQEEALSISDEIVVLNKGNKMQQGSPMEIYNDPKNEFVARFIGNPNINIFEVKTNGKEIFYNNESVMKVKDTIKDKKLTLGVRPENVSIKPSAKNSFLGYAKVEVVEQLGKNNILTLSLNKNSDIHIVVTPEQMTKLNLTKVPLYFERDKAFLFKPNGDRLYVEVTK